ncbi:MAG: hypothetical protein L7V29_07080, partial [Alphaproteobacteria bacterium]|nr:hypothetical protein [Alphaproteobacteria bacterium]
MPSSENKLHSEEKEERRERRLTIAAVEDALKDKLTPLLKVKSVIFDEDSGSLVVIECQIHGDQPVRKLGNIKKGFLCRECLGKAPLKKVTQIR